MGIREDVPGFCVVGEKGDSTADGVALGDRKGFVVRVVFESGGGQIDGSNLVINPETRVVLPQKWKGYGPNAVTLSSTVSPPNLARVDSVFTPISEVFYGYVSRCLVQSISCRTSRCFKNSLKEDLV